MSVMKNIWLWVEVQRFINVFRMQSNKPLRQTASQESLAERKLTFNLNVQAEFFQNIYVSVMQDTTTSAIFQHEASQIYMRLPGSELQFQATLELICWKCRSFCCISWRQRCSSVCSWFFSARTRLISSAPSALPARDAVSKALNISGY